ncbi:hypothetical protein CR513_08166, partial [Mucuna pruriens]
MARQCYVDSLKVGTTRSSKKKADNISTNVKLDPRYRDRGMDVRVTPRPVDIHPEEGREPIRMTNVQHVENQPRLPVSITRMDYYGIVLFIEQYKVGL